MVQNLIFINALSVLVTISNIKMTHFKIAKTITNAILTHF